MMMGEKEPESTPQPEQAALPLPMALPMGPVAELPPEDGLDRQESQGLPEADPAAAGFVDGLMPDGGGNGHMYVCLFISRVFLKN